MLSFYSAYIIRANDSNSLKFFLYILIVCVSTDIGGYIFGKIFKGPKLIKISPNKTISGSIGSFILSILTSTILLNYIFNTLFLFDMEKWNFKENYLITPWQLLWMCHINGTL